MTDVQPKPNIAPESHGIQQFRKSVNEELISQTAQLNELLANKKEHTTNLIKHWLTRHEAERVNLKGKISIFDNNEHPEATHNRHIAHLILELKGVTSKSKPSASLKGRVTNPEETS